MDHVPSKSISKSILLVTPLFLFVLAVLHASSEVSYLFILKFINNVAGSADMTFLPTLQSEVSSDQFYKSQLLNDFNLNYKKRQTEGLKFPLLNITENQKWLEKYKIIKGASPRWMLPTKVKRTDTMLLVLDVQKQKDIGIMEQDKMKSLDGKQVAMQQSLVHKLGLERGDVIPVTFEIKNLMNGLKLFEKFQDESSENQYKPDAQAMADDKISQMLFDFLKESTKLDINETEFKKIANLIINNNVTVQYTLKETFYPEGLYASAISNVVIMQRQGFTNLLANWITKMIEVINQEQLDTSKFLPKEYERFWPTNQFQIQSSYTIFKSQIKPLVQNFSLMMVFKVNDPEQLYKPRKDQKFQQFSKMLQNIPGNVEVIVLYPFFRQTLAIKYFFDSVIQIFEFVTFIIYFYTMTLIMKQIYQEKQIEVGIWRTLGAGAVSQKKKPELQIQLSEKDVRSRGSGIKYTSQFEQTMSFKEKIKFYSKLAIKVGFINYWLLTLTISLIQYFLLKQLFYFIICYKLGFNIITQPFYIIPVIFILVFLFIQALVYHHIRNIYTNPLSETIKPVKRTFDLVKIKVIHVATFGISFQVLLIAVMLVYYGVVSYYWIPFAVLDGQDDLQVLLFNTIFLFMIFGSIILLSILQSKIEMGIFSLIFRASSKMRCMKLAILKNIKAKRYKNIKVGIIISIIFAFILFFTAGIKIQMQIVESFIQRALGSNLVFENYEKKTFDNAPIETYLNDQGLQFSWLSKSLGRENVSISLVSHITGNKIRPEFQVLSFDYLNSTFYQYYYPQKYLPESNTYSKLPNSILNGFNSIYNGQESVGKFDPQDTLKQIDPFNVNIFNQKQKNQFESKISPSQQIIRLVVSSALRKQMGVNVGDLYKMQLYNSDKNVSFLIRCQVTHSFKAGPGFDLLGKKAFISQQQAQYIYQTLGIDVEQAKKNEKLFIKGDSENLKGVGSTIVSMSPQHTQMFEIQFVSQSFQLLSKYLSGYIVLITCIMSTLLTIFIFLYTLGKCKQQAQMFKMLRAIGLSARNIRIMIFSQIIIRLIVAVLGGIGLGILFSVGFSLQIEQFLMIKTPLIDITLVSVIGVVLLIIFSITIERATRYLEERTVADTNKI